MSPDPRIARFLSAQGFGVVGASADRAKYGNKVLRCYLQHGRHAIPVNPRSASVEGVACVPSVADLPEAVTSLSIITPPAISEHVVTEALARGIRNLWLQPGAESPAAVAVCEAAGGNCIADGSCLLVVLGYRDDWEP
ncbi:MAG TPA: CoA-binding protein [Deferrisomatales bacterium]|nr:CoA-binding protein [Deferrisomatales bacterium]